MKQNELFVILGSSNNPQRPSYLADRLLRNKGYKTLNIAGDTEMTSVADKGNWVNEEKTVAIFLKPNQQKKYYNYLLELNPSQIIFNPGTENEELTQMAKKRNIKVLSGCTISLVMNCLL